VRSWCEDRSYYSSYETRIKLNYTLYWNLCFTFQNKFMFYAKFGAHRMKGVYGYIRKITCSFKPRPIKIIIKNVLIILNLNTRTDRKNNDVPFICLCLCLDFITKNLTKTWYSCSPTSYKIGFLTGEQLQMLAITQPKLSIVATC